MNPEPGTLNPERRSWLACGVIVFAALAAYHNSFSGPFIFDDLGSATGNPTIQHLWPVWKTLSPPPGQTVSGRPLLNFSLALNYALSGDAVWSYHALNLLIHIFAALTLFGIVQRTLLRLELSGCGQGVLTSRLAARKSQISNFRSEMLEPTWLALAIAVIWTVHPLQTESVTYIVQRAESLMGLFYLLTIYCFIRGADSRSQETGVRSQEKESEPRGPIPDSGQPSPDSCLLTPVSWLVASLFFCLIGMATKEVMVSAPLMVLLYDRTFVAGTFRGAWQQRRKFYLSLASTWLLLGYLVTTTGGRGISAGFGVNIAWWTYALTQFHAIVHYLQLSLWPNPLVFDYGTTLAKQPAEIAPYAAIVLLLAIGTAFALWRHPAIGFLGCWFFAILAPSSSIVPIATETMAEHRMYLTLAAVVVLVVLGLNRLLGRRSLILFAALAAGLGCVTVQRNKDYKSEMSIWTDSAAKCPGNARTHNDLGNALLDLPGQLNDAIAQYQGALQIEPESALIHYNLGNALSQIPSRLPEAVAEDEIALRIKPDYADAHYNLGNAFAQLGRWPDAIDQYEAALRTDPDSADTYDGLGLALLKVPGRLPDVISRLKAAVRNDPNSAEAHKNLGLMLLKVPGHLSDAIAEFQAALRINPDDAKVHNGLGTALARQGRVAGALAEFAEAVRIAPQFTEAHFNLGNALAQSGRLPEAIEQYELSLQLKPDSAAARNNLEQARHDLAAGH